MHSIWAKLPSKQKRTGVFNIKCQLISYTFLGLCAYRDCTHDFSETSDPDIVRSYQGPSIQCAGTHLSYLACLRKPAIATLLVILDTLIEFLKTVRCKFCFRRQDHTFFLIYYP